MNYCFKISSLFVDPFFYNRGGNSRKLSCGWNVGTHLPTIFLLLCTFQFCACCVRKCFISKLLFFTTLMVFPCWVDDGYAQNILLLTAVIWPWKERMSLGQMLFEFLLPRMQGSICCLHLRPSQAALNILLRAVISWHSVSNTHHFYCVFDTKPNCQAEWSGGKSAMAMCFYPQSSEIIMMPRCQPIKLYSSEQGLNSWQCFGSEVYPTNGLGSLCLLTGIWNKSPMTFFQQIARRKLNLLSYI